MLARLHPRHGRQIAGGLACAALVGLCAGPEACAQEDEVTDLRLRAIEVRMSAQERRLLEQEAVIERQRRRIDELEAAPLDAYRAGRAASDRVPVGLGPDRLLAEETRLSEGGGLGPDRLLMAEASIGDGRPAPRYVGEAPPAERQVRQVAAMPEQAGVLTPRGEVLLEPTVEYSRTSSNRLVYRGVEIVPGVQLGVIEASDADRNSGVFTLGARYGLTNRLELEARVPYVVRRDQLTTLRQRDDQVTLARDVEGSGVGDVELALRYQINAVRSGAPIFIGALRAKPPTGKGPYDITYDEFGVAEDLTRGSGFWGAEAGVTMLYPSDPAVIYASLGYNYNIPGDVNKTLGDVFIGRVDPGDSVSASLGFGLALNPRLSVSLGYSHNYVFPTRTQVGDTTQESSSIQIGSMLMGMSFRLDDEHTISGNFEFGVTSDAPDVRFVVRSPLRY